MEQPVENAFPSTLSGTARGHDCAHLTEMEPESWKTQEVGAPPKVSACLKHSLLVDVAVSPVKKALLPPGGPRGSSERKRGIFLKAASSEKQPLKAPEASPPLGQLV